MFEMLCPETAHRCIQQDAKKKAMLSQPSKEYFFAERKTFNFTHQLVKILGIMSAAIGEELDSSYYRRFLPQTSLRSSAARVHNAWQDIYEEQETRETHSAMGSALSL